MELILMAAGASRRYGSLKQAQGVGPHGETIADYSVHDAVAAGLEHLVVVTRHDIYQEYREQVGRRLERHVEVSYAFQDDAAGDVPQRAKPWGTAHAVLVGGRHVSGAFGVVNADDFYGPASFRLLLQHLSTRSPLGVLVAFRLANTMSDNGTVTRGICSLSETDRLLAVDETFEIAAEGESIVSHHYQPTRRYTGAELVSMNMWGFPAGFLEQLAMEWHAFLEAHAASDSAEFYIPDAVSALLGRGALEVTVLPTPERWVGLTNPGDEQSARALIGDLTEASTYPGPLWSSEDGVSTTMSLPKSD